MRGKTGTRRCIKCGESKSLFVIARHERSCGKDTRKGLTPAFLPGTDGLVKCPVCLREFCKRGRVSHWRLAHVPEPRSWGSGGPGWNKSSKPNRTPGQNGGIRKGSGHGKSGWYLGYWCDSSWELAWVIYALDLGLKFTRNTLYYDYDFDGRKYRYYPDFLLEDGHLVEVKGYIDPKNAAKIRAVPGIAVIGKKEIQPFLAYARKKFGPNYALLCYSDKPTAIYQCKKCPANVAKRNGLCRSCARRKRTKFKIEWPNLGILRQMVSERKLSGTALALGVSINAVAKRLKNST